jgi:thiol-disulfide isomerase/thioredoxin
LLALALGACHRSTAVEAVPARLRVVDAVGLSQELERMRGHPVFVNFWASWCEPCIEEFPALVQAAKEWRPRGIAFVSISADEPGDLRPVEQTLQHFGAPFDSVLVASGDVDALIRQVDADWMGALPASFLYDASGAKIRRELGPITAERLRAWFRDVLNDRS